MEWLPLVVEKKLLPSAATLTGEIFISTVPSSDTRATLDILAVSNTIAVTDPVYPVYVDTNVMVTMDLLMIMTGTCQSLQNDFAAETPVLI